MRWKLRIAQVLFILGAIALIGGVLNANMAENPAGVVFAVVMMAPLIYIQARSGFREGAQET